MAKRKISKKKVSIFVIIVILIIAAITFFIFLDSKKDDTETIKVEDVDTIEGYDYTLKSNSTKYFKDLFKQLKECLEADEIDEDEYAELVSKMFIADFFNLDNKISKNDVGGVQFVYEGFRDDFIKLVSTSIYKNVESNLYDDREQNLPVVTNVSIEKGDNTTFTYGDQTDDNAYIMNFEIEYDEDLDYQTSGTLTLIHNDKKLEVAAMEETN